MLWYIHTCDTVYFMFDPERDRNVDGTLIESADDEVLRQLSGASFLHHPGLRIILPSGKTINRDEALAFASLFGSDTVEPTDY